MRIEIVITNTVGLNLMPAKTVVAIKRALERQYEDVVVTTIDTRKDLADLIERKPDLVFSGVKYLGFNKNSKKRFSKSKIWLSSVLKKHGINHTGSETAALKLDMNKVHAKIALLKQEIPTADFFTVFPGKFDDKLVIPIAFPLFIKPIYEGDGTGIDENSIVRNFKEYKYKVLHLHSVIKTEVLIERYLPGREFTVGILMNQDTNKLDAFPVELIAQENLKGDHILGRKEKQEDHEQVIAIKNKMLLKKVAQFAKKSFKALGARDYGRIDIRMDQNNKLHFLEANLVPGLGLGYFARAYMIGRKKTYSNMINTLATLALNRAA